MKNKKLYLIQGVMNPPIPRQTHSEAKLPAELVVLGGLRKETPKGSLPLCPLCEGYAAQKPSDQNPPMTRAL